MKTFFKTLFAVVIGIIISVFLLFIFFLGLLTNLVSQSANEVTTIPSNSILKLTFDKPITERSANNPFEEIDWLSLKKQRSIGLKEILENIEKAKNDNNITGIYLELSNIPSQITTIKEIRDALENFKESGKFIYAYGDYLTQTSYYLATVAHNVYLNPQGSIEWKGLRSEVLFFKVLIKKLGIEAEVVRHGKYKSAIEPFTNDKMSRENREQIQQLTSTIWKQMVYDVAKSRNINESTILRIANNLTALNADSCFYYRLVDSLLYKDQMQSIIADQLKCESKNVNYVNIFKYQKVPQIQSGKGFSKNKIAIIYAYGDVVMGDDDEGTISSERITDAIKQARTDTAIKAIVLRVNSPGGSALASEIIWREVKLARLQKPVVASFGNYAASGGYYIACAANVIVAQSTTITGSIGVFGIMFNGKKLMNEKLGITTDLIKTNQYSDFPSIFRPMDNYEKYVMQAEIERIYNTFINHVADGRQLPIDVVNEIAQGRVWSGVDAKNINLIDTLGTFTDAILIAAKLANVDHYRLIHLPKLTDAFEKIIKNLTDGAEAKIFESIIPGSYPFYRIYKTLSLMEGIQARLPFELYVY